MSESQKINVGWETLNNIVGCKVKQKFSAYGWYEDVDLRISKDDNWTGWWNECYCLASIWAKTGSGRTKLTMIKSKFEKLGWTVNTGLINGGISLSFNTMTKEESKQKAYNNLINGGRMSD